MYVLGRSIRVSVCICDVTLINSRVTLFGLTSSHSQVFTQVIGHIIKSSSLALRGSESQDAIFKDNRYAEEYFFEDEPRFYQV